MTDVPRNQFLVGHVLDKLRELPDGCVSACVTSPPYWNLRDYKVPKQLWPEVVYSPMPGADPITIPAGEYDLGNEPTLEAYVGHLVCVFREVRRVLRDDAVCCVNLGDSYHGGGYSNNKINSDEWNKSAGDFRRSRQQDLIRANLALKSGDLLGVPWRVAFALQAETEVDQIIKNVADRAWLAALIDGEGTISIARKKGHSNAAGNPRCQDSFNPFIDVGNTSAELLEHVVKVTGVGSIRVKDRPTEDSRGIKSRFTYYGWRVDSNPAMRILRDIYPYLIVKKKQAILAYSLDISNKSGRSLRGNKRLPEQEQKRRELLKELVNKCNQRECVDIPDWAVAPRPLVVSGWTLRAEIIWVKAVEGLPGHVGTCMPESLNGVRWERCRRKVSDGEYLGRRDPSRGEIASSAHHPKATVWEDCPGCPKCEATGGYALRRGSWRPTRAHEQVFLLSKGGGYFADAEAVKEPAVKGAAGSRFDI